MSEVRKIQIDTVINRLKEIESIGPGAGDGDKQKLSEEALRETLRYLSLSADDRMVAKVLEYASKRLNADAVLATLAAAIGSYISEMYFRDGKVAPDLAKSIVDSKLYYISHFVRFVAHSRGEDLASKKEGGRETDGSSKPH